MVNPSSCLDRVIDQLDALRSQSTAIDNRDPGHQEGRTDESVSRTFIPLVEEAPLEKKPSASSSRDQAWHLTSRHITADQASSHAHNLEPAIRVGLARAAFEGRYMIQVGFDESILQHGTLLEEIHLLLDGNLRLPERDICMIFAPIFAPFPGIVYTPGETFYVPIDPPAQGILGFRLESRGSHASGKSGTTTQGAGSSGNARKGSEDQNKKSAKGEGRPHRKMPGGEPDPGDSPSDDDDEGDNGKKAGEGEPKGKGRQRGPRVITIPFQSTLSITGLNGECDRFITNAGIDITVRFARRNSGLHLLMITPSRSTKIGHLVQLFRNGPGRALRSRRLSCILIQLKLTGQLIFCRSSRRR